MLYNVACSINPIIHDCDWWTGVGLRAERSTYSEIGLRTEEQATIASVVKRKKYPWKTSFGYLIFCNGRSKQYSN